MADLGRADTLRKLRGEVPVRPSADVKEMLSPVSPGTTLSHSGSTAFSMVRGEPDQVPPSPASMPSRASSSASARTTPRLSVVSSHPSVASPVSPIKEQDSDGVFPLSIPTKHNSIFSGFPYHQSLFDIHVSPKQWEMFNDDIQKSLDPSTYDRVAAKISRFNPWPIGPIGLTVKSIKVAHDRTMASRVLESLQEDTGGKAGELAIVVRKWNEEMFSPHGLEARIQLTKSAISRVQKEDQKRKEQERRTRKKYGTTAFYKEGESDVDSLNPSEADKRYHIVITRIEAPPEYSHEDGITELSTDAKCETAAMLDSTPTGPVAIELPDTSTLQIAELPAAVPEVPASTAKYDAPLPDVAELPAQDI